MSPIDQYIQDRDDQVRQNMKNGDLSVAAEYFTEQLVKTNYVKNWTWAGVPIIQLPTDLMVMQEIIWEVKPDIVIETGVAFGGSLLFYATILNGIGAGDVLGIDIEIRQHTYDAIRSSHSHLRNRIGLINRNSTDEHLIKILQSNCHGKKVLVLLDSNHTRDHVLKELELYAPLVSVGSYIVVFDTAIEFYGHLDKNQGRPWGKDNSPYTAVMEFLKTDMGQSFVIDKEVEMRALITSAPDGFLRRIK